jgi:hypothetical protein
MRSLRVLSSCRASTVHSVPENETSKAVARPSPDSGRLQDRGSEDQASVGRGPRAGAHLEQDYLRRAKRYLEE